MAPEIPEAARRLVSQHIHSVEQLEVLLLVRAAPDKEWTPAEVARALVTAEDTARLRLDDLNARRLLVRTSDAFRYAPDAETDRAVAELAQAYANRRVAVISLIFSKPSDAVMGFSDAFRIRRDK